MSNNTEDDAALCERLLGGEERVDARAAFARFQARRAEPRFAKIPFGWVGALAAAVVIVLLVTTPLGSLGQSFLTIFQPKAFAPIDVSALHLRARLLPNLDEFGTLGRAHSSKPKDVASAAAASEIAGFRALVPAVVPSQVPATSRFVVNLLAEESFRFSAAKARASAARKKRALPEMPARLDGTTVTASIGPTIVQTWGVRRKRSDGPILVVVQSVAPIVRSTGASLGELESYLLSMPGISPELASQIRAIGDPSSTLPVPFEATKQTAQSVNVDGASGLAIGDNTGLGAGVMWEKDGKLYAVFGTLTQDEVLDVANSLQ
jgi:hypothetical protein